MNNTYDISITPGGDLSVISRIDESGKEIKSLSLVSRDDHVNQSINIRLKTRLKELFLHPEIGNRLNQIIGKRNTREVAEAGKSYLVDTITRQNFIKEENLRINVMPVDTNKLVYVIEVSTGPYSKIDVVLEVDLQNGIRRVI